MSAQGRYDILSEMVIGMTKADLVAVMVLNGTRGNGFSTSTTNPELTKKLPTMLRKMADLMEAVQRGEVINDDGFAE